MAFNADAYSKTLEPPSFTFKGQTFTGRVLSFNEAVNWTKRIEGLNVADPVALKQLGTEIFAQMGFDTTLIDDLVAELPYDGFYALLVDFFIAALGRKKLTPAQPQN
jgi:hypothetical protein